jgi:adenosylcobinamide-GDP ribazoletransferase
VSFVAAFRFLTVIPLPLRREPTGEEVGRSLVYFPVVGLLIGLLLAGINWVLRLFVPDGIVNALLIVAMVLVSGALHIDGFIDTCDGLAGNKPPQERWKVMKDSRAGAFGIAGAVLLLLVKFAALSAIPVHLLAATLVLTPVVSRWAMVYAIRAYPYALESGLGTVFKRAANCPMLTVASIFTLAVSLLLVWWAGISYYFAAALAIVAVVWLVTVIWGTYMRHKFAGLTGDSYGAVNEMAELAALATVAVLAFNGWLWVL